MPITKWFCSTCRREVELNHFRDECNGVHPDYAAAVLADRRSQEERKGVRVSMASSCPRKFAIMAAEDVAVDPLSYLTAMKGTAWHGMLEKGGQASEDSGIGNEISVEGIVAGIPISGKIDRVRERNGQLVVEDFKTGKDARAVFIKGGKSYGKTITGQGAPIEYKVQLSLYCDLYAQQFEKRPDAAAIWWWFSAEAWVEPIEIMPVEQCLTHRPGDGDYTVEQILTQAYAVSSGTVQWQDLPLVGTAIKFGPKFTACDYCDVRETCMIQAQGAPF